MSTYPEHLTTCEVPECGAEAFVATRDLQEIEPLLDAEGRELWLRFQPAGEWHPRCQAHPRPAETLDRDGQAVMHRPAEA